MSEKIPLPKFLKVLTSGNVPVAKAMVISSKIYKECHTAEQLSQLTDIKLKAFGVDEKDLRKLVLAAVKKAGYTPRRVSEAEHIASTSRTFLPQSTVDVITTPTKRKRKWTGEENEFLPKGPVDEASLYGSLEFNEVLEETILRTKSVVINRAPLMTAWATVVAERMGFQREEALSIASVYTEMNAISKGVSLGIFKAGKEKGLDAARGGTQPYVDFIGRRVPLYQNQKDQWRALLNGTPATPSAAYGYISRSFRQTTPHIIGALRLLVNSYSPQEINNKAWSLYADFRPEVNGWGKRSEVQCSTILDLMKPPGEVDHMNGSDGTDTTAVNVKYENTLPDSEPATGHGSKRQKTSPTVEDYEKTLDEDHNLNNAILNIDF